MGSCLDSHPPSAPCPRAGWRLPRGPGAWPCRRRLGPGTMGRSQRTGASPGPEGGRSRHENEGHSRSGDSTGEPRGRWLCLSSDLPNAEGWSRGNGRPWDLAVAGAGWREDPAGPRGRPRSPQPAGSPELRVGASSCRVGGRVCVGWGRFWGAESSFLLPGGSSWNAGPQAGQGVKAAALISLRPQRQSPDCPWAQLAPAASPLLHVPGLTWESWRGSFPKPGKQAMASGSPLPRLPLWL